MRYTCKVCGYIWDSRPADEKIDCPACERKAANAMLDMKEMKTHTPSDRYRHYKEETSGWQIRYGPAEDHGECVGHVHEEAHAQIICTAVNILLDSKERLNWKAKS